eukprot:4232636-Prymnesium_polylepis.2
MPPSASRLIHRPLRPCPPHPSPPPATALGSCRAALGMCRRHQRQRRRLAAAAGAAQRASRQILESPSA